MVNKGNKKAMKVLLFLGNIDFGHELLCRPGIQ